MRTFFTWIAAIAAVVAVLGIGMAIFVFLFSESILQEIQALLCFIGAIGSANCSLLAVLAARGE